MIERRIIGKGRQRKQLIIVTNWDNYQKVETSNSTETKPEISSNENPKVPYNNKADNVKIMIDKRNPPAENINNSIEERIQEFRGRIFTPENLKEYGQGMLKDFFSYWSEHNENGKSMRFELEKVFDPDRRLTIWRKNEKEFRANKVVNTQDIRNVLPDYSIIKPLKDQLKSEKD